MLTGDKIFDPLIPAANQFTFSSYSKLATYWAQIWSLDDASSNRATASLQTSNMRSFELWLVCRPKDRLRTHHAGENSTMDFKVSHSFETDCVIKDYDTHIIKAKYSVIMTEKRQQYCHWDL